MRHKIYFDILRDIHRKGILIVRAIAKKKPCDVVKTLETLSVDFRMENSYFVNTVDYKIAPDTTLVSFRIKNDGDVVFSSAFLTEEELEAVVGEGKL